MFVVLARSREMRSIQHDTSKSRHKHRIAEEKTETYQQHERVCSPLGEEPRESDRYTTNSTHAHTIHAHIHTARPQARTYMHTNHTCKHWLIVPNRNTRFTQHTHRERETKRTTQQQHQHSGAYLLAGTRAHHQGSHTRVRPK